MAAAAGALAGVALGSLFTGFVQDARESERVSRLTAQVIKTTGGAAHVTAQQVGELATAISNKTGVDDEAVQSASNLLLTFTQVRNEVGKGNDVFDQATQAAVDMAAVLGGDASSQAKILGKALNDPIKGLTALSRAGVSFTAQQKAQIQTYVEAGDVLSAQKIILQELGREFGGAAAAASDPLQRLGTIAGNLGEDIGGLLLPVISDLADFAADDLIPAIKDAAGWLGDTFGPAVGAVKDAIVGVVDIGADIVGFFNDLPGPIQAGVVALGAIVLLKGPVTNALETIALKALYARDAVVLAGSAGGALKKLGSGLLGAFGGPVGLAITGVTVGLGFLVSALSDTDDETEAVVSRQNDLTDALQASKGAIDANVRAAAAKVLQDEGILDTLEDMGIQTSLATDAILGNGDALGNLGAALQSAINAGTDFNGNQTDLALASQDAYNALYELAGQTEGSIASAAQLSSATAETGDAMAASAEQTAEATQALEDWLKKLQGIADGFVQPLGTYRDLLSQKQQAEQDSAQATADATDSSSDSWEDYVTDVSVSLDEYAQTLEDQLANQDEWADNLAIVAQRAGADVAQSLADMGEDGVDLVAQMADGTDAEVQRMADAIRADIQHGSADWTADLNKAMTVMAAIGAEGADATAQGIARQLGLGTAEVRRIAEQYGIQLAYGINPILSALDRPNVHLSGLNGFNTGGGFWAGGYTGDGGKYQPKGVVHGGEFVFTKEQTRKAGVGNLEVYAKMLSGYAGGGFVSTSSVPKPPSTAPYRIPISTAGDATMQKAYDETVAWVAANLVRSFGGGAGIGLSSGPIVDIVRSVANAYGWGAGSQWDALSWIINHESGWRPSAQNPTSTAYGLFQFLDGTWGGTGIGKTSDPRLQSVAGMRYIGSRYGDPVGAQAFWARNGWYDHGGWLQPGYTLAYNGTGRPERVVGPNNPVPVGSAARGGTPSVNVSFPSGMVIRGQVSFDPSGIATIAGVVVDQALGQLTDGIDYAGGAA